MFKILGLLVVTVISFQVKAGDDLSDFKKARISFTAPKGFVRCERITDPKDNSVGVRATRYGKHQIEKKGNAILSSMKDDTGRAVVESHFRTRIDQIGGYHVDKFDRGTEQVDFVNLRKLCNDHRALFEGDQNVSISAKDDKDDDDKEKDGVAPSDSAPAPAPAPGGTEN